jgi:hypothetical protein
MLFINNKYTKWYYTIINNAKDRLITEYSEKHHIIPRSLGGTNDKNNIIRLTSKEHFVVHLLLTKMTIGNAKYKMNFALHMLSNAKNIGQGRYIPSGKIYEIARKAYREALDLYWTHERRLQNSIMKKKKEFKHNQRSIIAISEYQKRKQWTKKALENRLNNCLKAAKDRKGSKWSDERKKQKFQKYIEKNRNLFPLVFELADQNLNTRQISLRLEISWDRVNYILVNRFEINKIL